MVLDLRCWKECRSYRDWDAKRSVEGIGSGMFGEAEEFSGLEHSEEHRRYRDWDAKRNLKVIEFGCREEHVAVAWRSSGFTVPTIW